MTNTAQTPFGLGMRGHGSQCRESWQLTVREHISRHNLHTRSE
jgi:hypothetical protein